MTEEDYDSYIVNCKEFERVSNESNENVDKKQYATATGSLAISIAVLPFFEKTLTCELALVVGWCLIVISIGLNILSHLCAEKRAEKGMEEINNLIAKRCPYDRTEIKAIFDKASKGTRKLNLGMITTLFLGMISLLVFIVYNVGIN